MAYWFWGRSGGVGARGTENRYCWSMQSHGSTGTMKTALRLLLGQALPDTRRTNERREGKHRETCHTSTRSKGLNLGALFSRSTSLTWVGLNAGLWLRSGGRSGESGDPAQGNSPSSGDLTVSTLRGKRIAGESLLGRAYAFQAYFNQRSNQQHPR